MKKDLLNYIVCPKCKSEFKLEIYREENSEIIEGILICKSNHSFPISKGVPRLLDERNFEISKKQVQDSFSKKWAPETGAGLSGAAMIDKEFYNDWYLEKYGFKNLDGLKNFLKDKKFVIDAGTGPGRDALLFSEISDGIIFAVDLSNSVEGLQERYKDKKNIYFIQTDIMNLPFKENFFDYISCDFVIHHTPNPIKTFNHLVSHLKKGGQIATYTYKIKGPVREFVDDDIRERTTKMSFEECYKICEPITKLGKTLSDLNIEFEVPEDIPLLGIKAGKQNLQRFIYWNFMKCYWSNNLSFKDNVIVNVDWYHPIDAFRFKPEEIKSWAHENNLDIINFHISEPGISIRAKKL